MRRYRTVWIPKRKKTRLGKAIRGHVNAKKRRDMACGVVGLICIGLGAGAGGWGGAAIGLLVAGAIIGWVCNTPNI